MSTGLRLENLALVFPAEQERTFAQARFIAFQEKRTTKLAAWQPLPLVGSVHRTSRCPVERKWSWPVRRTLV